MASSTVSLLRDWRATSLPALRPGLVILVAGLALAWAVTWLTAGSFMELAAMRGTGAAPSDTMLYLALAGGMMVAMMLPAARPALRYYASSQGALPPRHVRLHTGLFGAGYFLAWTAFAATVIIAAARGGFLAPMGMGEGGGVFGLSATGAAVLVAAGAYQLLPWKRVCLGKCSTLRFPADDGVLGTVAAFGGGIRYAAYCLGTCWLLMLALFTSAAMGLAWMLGLSAFIAAERFAPETWRLRQGAGVTLMAVGGFALTMMMGGG